MSQFNVTPRSTGAALSILAVAFGVTGCGPSMSASTPAPAVARSASSGPTVPSNAMKDDDEYAEVCVDKNTNQRVNDDDCDDVTRSTSGTTRSSSSSFVPMWLLMSSLNSKNHNVPAVGQVIPSDAQRVNTLPSKGSVYTGVSSSGGSVSDVKSSATRSSAGSLNNTTMKSSTSKSGSGFGSGAKSGGGTSGG